MRGVDLVDHSVQREQLEPAARRRRSLGGKRELVRGGARVAGGVERQPLVDLSRVRLDHVVGGEADEEVGAVVQRAEGVVGVAVVVELDEPRAHTERRREDVARRPPRLLDVQERADLAGAGLHHWLPVEAHRSGGGVGPAWDPQRDGEVSGDRRRAQLLCYKS